VSVLSLNELSELRRCKGCGAPVSASETLCSNCRTAHAATGGSGGNIKCSGCGYELPKEASFCSECGAAQIAKPDTYDRLVPGESTAPPQARPLVSHRLFWPVAAVVVIALVTFAFRAQVKTSPSGQSAEAVETPQQSAQTPARIITKDPEWSRLLHPPTAEDDILAYSKAYLQKKQEIEAKLAQVSDPDLRAQLASEEWVKVDKQSYIAEGEENLRASWSAEMHTFAEKHRADWFEIGHVDYPGSGSLLVKSVDASPLEVPEGETIPLDLKTMDSVYSKFRQVARPAIQSGVDRWMDEQTCSAHLKNACENLGGSPGECSDPAKLQEIEEQLGQGGILSGCNDNPSAETGRGIIEKQVRESRLVLVGQGDLPTHRIDKLLLVDYDTETPFLELPPSALNGAIVWKSPADSVSPQQSASVTSEPALSSTAQDTSSEGLASSQEQSGDEQALHEAVDGWADAFRARDAAKLAGYYAPEVEQYFRKKNVPRSQIQSYIESAFAKIDSIRQYDISDLKIETVDAADSATRATATYNKQWETSQTDGKTFSGEEVERLTFAMTAEGWKIVREEEVNVIRASRR